MSFIHQAKLMSRIKKTSNLTQLELARIVYGKNATTGHAQIISNIVRGKQGIPLKRAGKLVKANLVSAEALQKAILADTKDQFKKYL